jgi:Carbohydrate-selective porin, OprB family
MIFSRVLKQAIFPASTGLLLLANNPVGAEVLADSIDANPMPIDSLLGPITGVSQLVDRKAGEAELVGLRGAIDRAETKATVLEQQVFSTTTKLYGQAIFGLQGRFGNSADLNPRDGVKETIDPATQITFGSKTRLSFTTDFPDHSRLMFGLQAANFSTGAPGQSPFAQNNSYTRPGYASGGNNQINLTDVTYRFSPARQLAFVVGPLGVNPSAVFRGPNRYESSAQGPISSFAQRNPILYLGGTDAGIGFDWQVNARVSLQGVYSAGDWNSPASRPEQGNGLFDGPNTIGLQLAAVVLPKLDLTAYYLRSYTTNAFLNTGVGDDAIAFPGSRFVTQAVGSSLSWRVGPKLSVGGWFGYTHSKVAAPNYSGTVSTTNWITFVNFPDLLGKGNVGGVYFGQPPKITQSDLAFSATLPGMTSGLTGMEKVQPDTTYHLEAFYRLQLRNNISLTPGIIVLFNPVQNRDSDRITIGVLRTSFSF